MGDSKSEVLSSFQLDESLVAKTLGEVLGHDVDDADLYFERVEADVVVGPHRRGESTIDVTESSSWAW